jgi:hypothetical protein
VDIDILFCGYPTILAAFLAVPRTVVSMESSLGLWEQTGSSFSAFTIPARAEEAMYYYIKILILVILIASIK